MHQGGPGGDQQSPPPPPPRGAQASKPDTLPSRQSGSLNANLESPASSSGASRSDPNATGPNSVAPSSLSRPSAATSQAGKNGTSPSDKSSQTQNTPGQASEQKGHKRSRDEDGKGGMEPQPIKQPKAEDRSAVNPIQYPLSTSSTDQLQRDESSPAANVSDRHGPKKPSDKGHQKGTPTNESSAESQGGSGKAASSAEAAALVQVCQCKADSSVSSKQYSCTHSIPRH